MKKIHGIIATKDGSYTQATIVNDTSGWRCIIQKPGISIKHIKDIFFSIMAFTLVQNAIG